MEVAVTYLLQAYRGSQFQSRHSGFVAMAMTFQNLLVTYLGCMQPSFLGHTQAPWQLHYKYESSTVRIYTCCNIRHHAQTHSPTCCSTFSARLPAAVRSQWPSPQSVSPHPPMSSSGQTTAHSLAETNRRRRLLFILADKFQFFWENRISHSWCSIGRR